MKEQVASRRAAHLIDAWVSRLHQAARRECDRAIITDFNYAYMIETAKTRAQDSWQIVFLLDRDRKVSEIVVHKNCC